MVPPTDAGNGDDLPTFRRLDRPLLRSVLFEPQMRAGLVVVVKLRPDHAPKLSFIDRDYMVQAISSKAANPSFRKSVLPG